MTTDDIRGRGNPYIKQYSYKTKRGHPLIVQKSFKVSKEMNDKLNEIPNWSAFVRGLIASALDIKDD